MDRSPAQTALLPASQALDPSRSVPAVLERAGTKALFAADEFFAARISNPHTRRAYARVVRRFLTWCEDEHLELPQVSPGLAGRFIDELPGDSSTKTRPWPPCGISSTPWSPATPHRSIPSSRSAAAWVNRGRC